MGSIRMLVDMVNGRPNIDVFPCMKRLRSVLKYLKKNNAIEKDKTYYIMKVNKIDDRMADVEVMFDEYPNELAKKLKDKYGIKDSDLDWW